jgi:hypothetical protein
MLRVCKNKILPILLSTLCVSPSFAIERKPASSTAFKFPVLLCVYQTTMADEQNGLLQLVHKESNEFAYRVDSNGASGKTSGSYEVEGTSYRVRFDAQITQNGGANGKTDSLQVSSYLEKKDSTTGEYVSVGQKNGNGSDNEADDGTIWKNVGARVYNPDFANLRNSNGKIDSDKVNLAFRDGALSRGSLVISGPVCGLLDLDTVKKVTSHTAELSDVFKKYDTAKVQQEQVAARQKEVQQQAPVVQPVEQPEQREQVEQAEREQNEPQQLVEQIAPPE